VWSGKSDPKADVKEKTKWKTSWKGKENLPESACKAQTRALQDHRTEKQRGSGAAGTHMLIQKDAYHKSGGGGESYLEMAQNFILDLHSIKQQQKKFLRKRVSRGIRANGEKVLTKGRGGKQ